MDGGGRGLGGLLHKRRRGGELRFGVIRRGSARLAQSVEAVLGALRVLALGEGADRRYGAVRATLEAARRPIGANDLRVAAHALAADVTLVTDNASEFGRVAGLRGENWLRARHPLRTQAERPGCG
jgi:tRNA(fMet)-specific endonuclease VapC